jgi:hypothetical protein
MTKVPKNVDVDLDIMNILKKLDGDTALYFRVDGATGFHYYTGTFEDLGIVIATLMEQDDVIYNAVVHAITEIQEG